MLRTLGKLVAVLLALGAILAWVTPVALTLLNGNGPEVLRKQTAVVYRLELVTSQEITALTAAFDGDTYSPTVDFTLHSSTDPDGLDTSVWKGLDTVILHLYGPTGAHLRRKQCQFEFTPRDSQASTMLLPIGTLHPESDSDPLSNGGASAEGFASTPLRLPSGRGSIRLECPVSQAEFMAAGPDGDLYRTPLLESSWTSRGGASGTPMPPVENEVRLPPLKISDYIRYASPPLAANARGVLQWADPETGNSPAAADQGVLLSGYDPYSDTSVSGEVLASIGNFDDDSTRSRRLFVVAALLGVAGTLFVESLELGVDGFGDWRRSGRRAAQDAGVIDEQPRPNGSVEPAVQPRQQVHPRHTQKDDRPKVVLLCLTVTAVIVRRLLLKRRVRE